MSGKIEIIKKPKFDFDQDLCLLDASNADKLFALHLSRCDDSQTAQTVSDMFIKLGNLFAQKVLDLTEKVS